MKARNTSIADFTWNAQIEKETLIDMTPARDWLTQKTHIKASSRSGWGTACVSFTRFLDDKAREDGLVPVPTGSRFGLYREWLAQVRLLQREANKHIKRMNPIKAAEAETNKRVYQKIYVGRTQEEKEAIAQMPNCQYMRQVYNKAKQVSLDNPQRDQFTIETFREVGMVLAISLLLTGE